MADSIKLSPKHGVNPSVSLCFFCGKDKNELVLLGRLKDDAEAPRQAVFNYEPCDECKGLMEKGIIFIEARDSGDPENPHRLGGWCVISEEGVRRALNPGPFLDIVLEKRMAFVTAEDWNKMGLPRRGNRSPAMETNPPEERLAFVGMSLGCTLGDVIPEEMLQDFPVRPYPDFGDWNCVTIKHEGGGRARTHLFGGKRLPPYLAAIPLVSGDVVRLFVAHFDSSERIITMADAQPDPVVDGVTVIHGDGASEGTLNNDDSLSIYPTYYVWNSRQGWSRRHYSQMSTESGRQQIHYLFQSLPDMDKVDWEIGENRFMATRRPIRLSPGGWDPADDETVT